ncbi:nSTAND1 domain-containing NTPase [Streptomyces lydicus]|uniref:nSTAND1 domain-containing NTPase n=1 Tax=Streptomyces lydicus TaxID=47763 RepID=UPI0036E08A8E
MSPEDDPAVDPAVGRGGHDGVHLRAHATGEAQVNQVGRDQHIHYNDGVGGRRRTVAGELVRECPYPGLLAFGPEESRWFFGREGLVAELVARLDQRVRTGGLQMVVAPSGAGKSSILRAGLLPALGQAGLPGSDRWPQLVLTPSADPVNALAARISSQTGAEARAVADELVVDPRQCLSTLLSSSPERERVVVVVDQFEELFTLCADDAQRRVFIDLLAQIANTTGDAEAEPVGLVLLGLRGDFYSACIDHPQLRVALQDAPLVVGAMTQAQVREAIIYPAQDVGLDIEPGLVDLLLRDLGAPATSGAPGIGGYEAGRLPLLAHALRALWQQRHGTTLTVQGYQNVGGIQHTIATAAEGVYTSLDGAGKALSRLLFLRLVKVGDGADDTRRRVSRAELTGGSADPAQMATVIDAFAQARLITLHTDTVEITHEALLHSWPRLHGWIDTDRASRLTHQDLEEAAATWERGRRDPSLLYRGSRLEAADTWAVTAPPDELSSTGRAFLAASTRARRRATRWRTGIIATLTALAVLASTAAVVAFHLQGQAVRQRDTVIYNQVLANADRLHDTDMSLSAQLNLVAHRMRPSDTTATRLVVDANSPLSAPLTNLHNAVTAVAYSPDGHTLAVSLGVTGGYTIQLWSVIEPTRPTLLGQFSPSRTDAVRSLSFSPDGHTLATGGADKSVRLWNITDPTHPTAIGRPLDGPKGVVWSVAFSPDGRTLAAAVEVTNTGSGLWLWNLSDPARPRLSSRSEVGPAYSVAFSRDGHMLAVADGLGDYGFQLWNVQDATRPKALSSPLAVHTNRVNSLAFSPDGHTLATGSADSTVRLWNVTDPAHVTQATNLEQPLSGHTGPVESVAFSPDGHMLATGSHDKSVRLWNVTDPRTAEALGQPLTGHSDSVYSVAFSPKGRTLATGSLDQSVRFWSLPSPASASNSIASTFSAFSPDWHVMATSDLDDTLRLWDISNPARRVPLGQPLTGVRWGVFSPDGRTLATGGYSMRLWDISNPARPVSLGRPLAPVDSAVFSPDGRTLATTSSGTANNKLVQLWNLSDLTKPVRVGPPLKGHTDQVLSMAFSPDGKILATGSRDHTVRLWNVSHPAGGMPLGQPLTGHIAEVTSVLFSPDGRTLATGSVDSTVRLWNVSDPARPVHLGQPLVGHTRGIAAMTFRPDGRVLVTGSYDSSVRLWNLTDLTKPIPPAQSLTGHAGGVEQVAFSPDGQILSTQGEDRVTRLWDMNVDHAIDRICAVTRKTLTAEEWRRDVGAIPRYNPPCT